MLETGKIVQVIGPVIDIRFSPENLPTIKNAIRVKLDDNETMTAEVAQHIAYLALNLPDRASPR